MNSYIIRGSGATALIDTTEPSRAGELLKNIDTLGVEPDYIISQHAEQDHSGALLELTGRYPDAEVLGTASCLELLENLLDFRGNMRAIEDGERLSLGDKTLKFRVTPWVHWPDTMVTYLEEERILFSCDFFGSHLATSELMEERPWKIMPI